MKKTSCILLAALLVASLLPVSAAAAENRLLEPSAVYKNDAPASVDTVEEKVDWIAQQCRASEAKGEWEIAFWLHNWIIYNADYDQTYTNHSASGVLLKGTGVCDSYSKAYAMLLDEFGIENQRLISIGMDHAWNLVKLNGQWCHIDCTWDDPIGEKRPGRWNERAMYFGLSDTQMRRDHTWNTWEYPACTSEINSFSKQTSCGPDATWSYDNASGTLTISGNGDVLWQPWKEIPAPEDPYGRMVDSVMRKLVIKSGITGIGWGAFENSGLEEITIPGSVKIIGGSAFQDAHRLKEVLLPQGVTAIGKTAFAECWQLTEITIPASVAHIDETAFSGCSRVTLFRVDENNPGYSSDSAGILYNKDKTAICFVPGTVSGEISIPAGVARIDETAFSNCSYITAFRVDENNPTYSSDSAGVLFNKEKTVLLAAPKALVGAYTVPDGVVTIADAAFRFCEKLTEVIVPDSVETIGAHAFYGAFMQKVILGSGVTTIGEEAFAHSTVAELTLPAGLKTIGRAAFNHCFFLTEITIPGTVTQLEQNTFSDCIKLKQVTLSEGVTAIDKGAFSYCSELAAVTIPVSLKTVGDYAFYDCRELKDVYYNGTKGAFGRINTGIYNTPLLEATLHFGAAPAYDLNKDGELTTDDAVYLLLHVMFGDGDYPIEGETDMNGDGSVTTDDAVYLLLHIMFGAEDYPLAA